MFQEVERYLRMDDRLALPGRNYPNLVFDRLTVLVSNRSSLALHVVDADRQL